MTVLGQKFSIAWVTEEADALSSRPNLGRTEVGRQRMTVDATMGEDQQRDTLVHELLHACLRMIGFDLPDRVEERTVAALAPILLDALRANPEVTKWLTA